MLHLVQLRKGLSRELLNDFFFIKILHELREEFPTELKLFFHQNFMSLHLFTVYKVLDILREKTTIFFKLERHRFK